MIAYSTNSKEIQGWRKSKPSLCRSLPPEVLNCWHPPCSPLLYSCHTHTPFLVGQTLFMPRKSHSLLWSHAGIAQQWKNIATRKICLTVLKMLEWANSPYQSLCKGIKPVSQIPLFIISLGLFPNNLENVWLFLYLKRVCPVPKWEYGIFAKQGYLAWLAVSRTE